MKKKYTVVLVTSIVAVAVLAGAGFFVYESMSKKKETVVYETFAEKTTVTIFHDIPLMPGVGNQIGEVTDYGNRNYLVEVKDTSEEEYKEYLDVLADTGYKKHSDNGEDAMEGYAYTAAFTKEDVTVVVSHVIRDEKTYISATRGLQLSEHMIYKEEYAKEVIPGAKTTVHLVELGNFGSSFVIKLKNGHFVMHDGGQDFDAPYLLDYLEKLTPGDEKPIVEGWFISHPHGDHYGALSTIASNQEYANRILVNGIYFHYPPAKMLQSESNSSSATCSFLASMLQAEDGGKAGDYRPQYGQRYYFCDVIMDISMTSEQINVDGYTGNDVNDTSLWITTYIEGQKILIGGDANQESIRTFMNLFYPTYYDLDVFVVLHHGGNVYDYFTEVLKIKTLLYTSWRLGTVYSNKYPEIAKVEQNALLQSRSEECYSYEKGTVVMTFPYKVGTAEIEEPCKWQYDNGTPPQRTEERWGWKWDGLRYYYEE